MWTRAQGKVTPHTQRDIVDRESWRWIELALAARKALQGAMHVTLISDRESDFYEHWALVPGPCFDVLARAGRDRRSADGTMMLTTARRWDASGCYVFDVVARTDRARRQARMEVRFGAVTIAKPKTCKTKDMPQTITLNLVEVVEVGAPARVEPGSSRCCGAY